MKQIYQKGNRYKKDGKMVDTSERQTSLLDSYAREEVASQMQTLDRVNTLFGPGTLRFDAQGLRQAEWQMRQIYPRIIIAA